jgi:cell division protein FtsN
MEENILFEFSIKKTIKNALIFFIVFLFCFISITPFLTEPARADSEGFIERLIDADWQGNNSSDSPVLIYLLNFIKLNTDVLNLIEGEIMSASTEEPDGEFTFLTDREILKFCLDSPVNIGFYLPEQEAVDRTLTTYDSWLATYDTNPISVTIEEKIYSPSTVLEKKGSSLKIVLQPERINIKEREVLTRFQLITDANKIESVNWIGNRTSQPLLVVSRRIEGDIRDLKEYFALYLTVSLISPEDLMEKITLFQGGNIRGLNRLFDEKEIKEELESPSGDIKLHLGQNELMLSCNNLVDQGKSYYDLGLSEGRLEYLIGLEKNILETEGFSLTAQAGNELNNGIIPDLRLGISDEITYLDRIKVKASYFPLNYQLSRDGFSSNSAIGKLVIDYPFSSWGLNYTGCFGKDVSDNRLSLYINITEEIKKLLSRESEDLSQTDATSSLPVDYSPQEVIEDFLDIKEQEDIEKVLEITPPPVIIKKGQVTGQLIINGGGIEELGEVILSLNGKMAKTDQEGTFCFDSLEPGTYQLDLIRLSDDFKPGVELPLEVIIEAGEQTLVELPVIKLAAVKGRVYRDEGGNLSAENIDGVKGVRIILWRDNDNSGYNVTTDNWGEFQIKGLAPGNYTIEMEQGSLPLQTEVSTSSKKGIELKAGQIGEVYFGIQEKIIEEEVKPVYPEQENQPEEQHIDQSLSSEPAPPIKTEPDLENVKEKENIKKSAEKEETVVKNTEEEQSLKPEEKTTILENVEEKDNINRSAEKEETMVKNTEEGDQVLKAEIKTEDTSEKMVIPVEDKEEAISPGEESLRETEIPEEPITTDKVEYEPGFSDQYRVQVGAFAVEENAQQLRKKVEEMGYPVVITGNSLYRVQILAGFSQEEAESLSVILKKQGFENIIVLPQEVIKEIKQFIVQVGAFTVEENAQQLKQRVEKMGYSVIITGNSLYHVQILADFNQEEAESLIIILKKQGFEAFVVSTE